MAVTAGGILLLGSQSVRADRTMYNTSEPTTLDEHPLGLSRVDTMRVKFEPVSLPTRRPTPVGGTVTGECPTEVGVHTDSTFEGGAYVLQQGFAQMNVAAISIEVAPEKFPLRIDMTEMIFATANATVSTTTEWSLLVWEGTPSNGTLIEVFSSDDILLPHLVIPPGTNGVNVQVIVDPSDPEPIIVNNDGSNTFSIGYRIDKHNNPSEFLPNCFPPPAQENAFPVTDTSGLAAPHHNWVGSPNCDPIGCVVGGGYSSFFNLSSGCTPSGDWVMRVTYTPLVCPSVVGACCLPSGNCQILENFECDSLGGVFQGENLTCLQVVCPEPTGACCTGEPGKCQDLTQAQCDAVSGTWVAGTNCASNICNTANGACCIPDGGGCVDFPADFCDAVDGIFHGIGTSCATLVCFPIGACCLPDGTCAGNLSPEDCEALDGVFQGHESQCESVTCPAPEAACCLPNGNCLVLTENTCNVVNGTWAGIGTDCTDSNSNGTADACEDDDPCIGDINGDGVVDVSDLLVLLGAWGPCGDPNNCPADFNDDDVVDVSDLLTLLSAWGPCP